MRGAVKQKVFVSSGYERVSRKRPCEICGKPDWCVRTRDGEITICMRVSAESIRMNSRGGFIHAHRNSLTATETELRQSADDNKPAINLAPLEVRHAVYSELIRLSPATNYDRELVSGSDGLLSRGLLREDLAKFGALPPEMSERDKLSFKLSRMLRQQFPFLASDRKGESLIGVPGFWREPSGRVWLWKKVNYDQPFLLIPYRDGLGHIQACQLRVAGETKEKKKRYCWLSSAGEPQGVGTGDPLHFTFTEKDCQDSRPRLITEGALKGEAFVSLRPRNLVIATSGVGNSRAELIAATRGHDVMIAFDIDHRSNPSVCGQLAALIAERMRDAEEHRATAMKTMVIIWEGEAKGIDDAALAGIHLSAITARQWYATLEGDALERVNDVWDRLEYRF